LARGRAMLREAWLKAEHGDEYMEDLRNSTLCLGSASGINPALH
jgi:hypothetical protein